jgi:hypothetical protein
MAVKRQAPPVPAPPEPTTRKGSAWTQFVNKSAKQYPSLKANAPDIAAAAAEAHIDPIWFASLLLVESKADYNTPDSPKGAIGIGQVMPLHVGETVPWDPTRTVTQADLRAPTFNLRWSAYYAAQQIGKYGYAHAYNHGYNPGYTGPGSLRRAAEGLRPEVRTVADGAGRRRRKRRTRPPARRTVLNDRWAVLGTDGKIKFVKINDHNAPPKNVLKYGPTPLTQSSFISDVAAGVPGHVLRVHGQAGVRQRDRRDSEERPVDVHAVELACGEDRVVPELADLQGARAGDHRDRKQVSGRTGRSTRLSSRKRSRRTGIRRRSRRTPRKARVSERAGVQGHVAKLSNVYQSIYGKGGRRRRRSCDVGGVEAAAGRRIRSPRGCGSSRSTATRRRRRRGRWRSRSRSGFCSGSSRR